MDNNWAIPAGNAADTEQVIRYSPDFYHGRQVTSRTIREQLAGLVDPALLAGNVGSAEPPTARPPTLDELLAASKAKVASREAA